MGNPIPRNPQAFETAEAIDRLLSEAVGKVAEYAALRVASMPHTNTAQFLECALKAARGYSIMLCLGEYNPPENVPPMTVEEWTAQRKHEAANRE